MRAGLKKAGQQRVPSDPNLSVLMIDEREIDVHEYHGQVPPAAHCCSGKASAVNNN